MTEIGDGDGELAAIVLDEPGTLLTAEARAALVAGLRRVRLVSIARRDEWRHVLGKAKSLRTGRIRTNLSNSYSNGRIGDELILAVRLGAMGDILHALPAVASLKKSFPEKRIFWVVARKWMELLDGNPNIDEIVPFDRQGAGALAQTWRRLRAIRPEIAIDFQGLIQSAIAGKTARPGDLLRPEGSRSRASRWRRCSIQGE